MMVTNSTTCFFFTFLTMWHETGVLLFGHLVEDPRLGPLAGSSCGFWCVIIICSPPCCLLCPSCLTPQCSCALQHSPDTPSSTCPCPPYQNHYEPRPSAWNFAPSSAPPPSHFSSSQTCKIYPYCLCQTQELESVKRPPLVSPLLHHSAPPIIAAAGTIAPCSPLPVLPPPPHCCCISSPSPTSACPLPAPCTTDRSQHSASTHSGLNLLT